LGFICLDIYDNISINLLNRFGYTVCAGFVRGSRHNTVSAEGFTGGQNGLAVRSDDNLFNKLGPADSLKRVLNEIFTCIFSENFAGKSC
jgi:hypothetical protein